MMPGDGETVTSLPGGSLKLPDTARTGRVSAMSHGSVTGIVLAAASPSGFT